MAVLNKIRQRSVFLIIIIALALFSFVLADLIKNGGFNSKSSQNVIATVNGTDIGREEFAREVENLQRNMGGQMSTTQAVNRVWDQKLREVILQNQIEDLGIRAGEAQIINILSAQMAGDPRFTNEAGMVDENRIKEYMATLKSTSPQAYEQLTKNIAKSARINTYYNMISAGVGATVLEGEQAYRFRNDNISLEFVKIPYSSIPDEKVEISKSEIKNYIKEHPAKFKTEASRSIQYVVFNEEASPEDKAEAKQELTNLRNQRVEYNAAIGANDTLPGFNDTDDYAEFIDNNSDLPFDNSFKFRNDLKGKYADSIFKLKEGETFGPYEENGYWKISKVIEAKKIPDSVKASHILIAYQGSAPQATRTKAQAKELADSIAGVVKKDKSKFADLAAEYSADTSNKDNAGDLGYFTPGMMIPAFNDFVFQNSEGDIGVVETQYGYHVIYIEDQTEPAPAVRVATLAREITPSEGTMNKLFNEVTKFEMSANENNFNEVAKEGNYDVKTVRDMKALDENIPGVGSERRIVQWTFNEDTEAGDIKRFDTSNGYVVAQLISKNDAGLMSVEEASSIVTPILRKEKKAEMIKNNIKGNTLQEIASNHNVQVEQADAVNLNTPTLPGAGKEPKVVGTVFGLKEGEVAEPIAGEKGVFVAKLLSRFKAPEMENYTSYAQQETMERRAQATSRVFDALKKKADIEDKRAKFY
ncbi:peptidylprolyl isomerase [Christiangramia fulva]|uniref:Periplasmic chaperone PpiD n=1 Tax=Christiangramia fulva TaxID=2126553 RepID=A0A2R3Z254_9FLAO|nr:peptidylprolyl isomerase [Christiangramia fulva]AVR44322.1 peptidylprolyl isomerase [Christiangramia fulva]